ncbi:MAG: hypothetical protein LBE82_04940 [Chitinophagaceae bacterium]|jgi:hypothetical protein|nr:hypothetical protein [Chitinophagaceae bacterium]
MQLYLKIIEFIALLTGICACFFFRPFYFKLVVGLLAYTLFNGLIIISSLKKAILYGNNIALNIFSLIDMAVFFYIFFRVFTGSAIRKYIAGAAVLVYIYTFTELFFLRSWRELHTDSMRVYEMVIIIFSILYLYKLLKKEYYIVVIDPVFWLCSACLIYHSILIINFTTIADKNYWNFKDAVFVSHLLLNIANTVYYLLLCSMFISGIYYSKWRKKKASSQL